MCREFIGKNIGVIFRNEPPQPPPAFDSLRLYALSEAVKPPSRRAQSKGPGRSEAKGG